MEFPGFEPFVLDPRDPEVFDLAANIPALDSTHWRTLDWRYTMEQFAVRISFSYDAWRSESN